MGEEKTGAAGATAAVAATPPREAPFPWTAVSHACAVIVLGLAAAYSFLWTSDRSEWQWIHVFDDALNFYNPHYPYHVDNVQGMSHFDGWTWENVRWMWTTRHTAVYEPLSWMLKAAVFSTSGMDPLAYRRASLLLHTVNTLLCFALLLRVLPRAFSMRADWRVVASAAVGALFFGVHPLRAEVVAWPSGQAYTPCGMFVLLSVHAYLSYTTAAPRSSRRALFFYTLALLAFGASLLSKSASLLAWTALPALDWVPLRRFSLDDAVRNLVRGRMDARTRRCVVEKLPFLALSVVVVYFAVDAGNVEDTDSNIRVAGSYYSFEPTPAPLRVMRFFKTMAHVGVAHVWPVRLHIIQIMMRHRIAALDAFYTLPAVACAVAVWCAVALRHRMPALLAAGAVVLATMLPTANLAYQHGMGIYAADRYAYLPGMVAAVLLGALLLRVLVHEPSLRTLALSCAVVLIATLVVLSNTQALTWRTGSDVMEHATRCDPGLAPAYLNRARHMREVTQDAHTEVWTFERCVGIDPTYDGCLMQLGEALLKQGDWEGACRHYGHSLAWRPDHVFLLANLAICHDRWWHNPQTALQLIDRVVELRPDYAYGWMNWRVLHGVPHEGEALRIENA